MAKRAATVQIKQIAERVGMSQSTVSIVLNGRGDEMRISKESQQRILETAREMNYHPNIYARRLRGATSDGQEGQIVAVFWNENFVEDTMGRYFSGLFRAVEENQYPVEFMVKMFKNGYLSELRDSMNLKKYSGILIMGAAATDLEFLNGEELDVPIVVNRPSNKYSSVYVDGYEVGAECARLFAGRGFHTAGVMGADVETVGVGLRELGFLNECRERGIEVRREWIVKGDRMDMENGYECAKRFLEMKERPEGLFIMLDSLALGAMIQFKGSGLRIPEEMAVVAFGLNPMLKHISPSVTMIGNSMADTGETALKVLMTVINNNIKMPISKLIPPKYEFGDSFPAAK